MKNRIIAISILIVATLLLFPAISNQWHKRQLEKTTTYLREIYLAVVNENAEREPQGKPNVKSLDEVLDDQTKERMKKDGIDWRDIRYFPQLDDASESNILFSVDYSDYHVEVKKGGGVFYSRKKHAEPSAPPNHRSPSAPVVGGR
ncbi:MAG: hypothetical protein RBU24_08290 [Kiritimatiellia bacterium]|jgi:hypothetical protein|nr:hypothetical protein [Kiritimatiellia bacterium]